MIKFHFRLRTFCVILSWNDLEHLWFGMIWFETLWSTYAHDNSYFDRNLHLKVYSEPLQVFIKYHHFVMWQSNLWFVDAKISSLSSKPVIFPIVSILTLEKQTKKEIHWTILLSYSLNYFETIYLKCYAKCVNNCSN